MFTSDGREVPIPIKGSVWPILRAVFPLTEEAWAQMMSVLAAMKPGLVQAKPVDTDDLPSREDPF